MTDLGKEPVDFIDVIGTSNVDRSWVADLCVVGSGPAGLIVALQYAQLFPNRRLLVLEFGSDSTTGPSSLDCSIEVDNLVNHHPPFECTNKGLGGTSATWGGRCVMYEPLDFLQRSEVAGGCTWDSGLLEELSPFLQTAADYFDCGRPVFQLDQIAEHRGIRIAEHFQEGDFVDTGLERWSLPTRFGKRYRERVRRMPNLTFISGVEARDFLMETGSDRVTGLRVRSTATGRQATVQADQFVIAAGGQESTRLLLRNPQLFQAVEGPSDALGRYYQGHLLGKIASVRFYGDPKKTDFGFRRDSDGTYIRRRFQPSPETMLREHLLNTVLWLDNPLYHDPAHGNGPMSLMYLAMITPGLGRRLAPPAIAASITKGRVHGVGQHLKNVVRGLPGSLTIPGAIFYRRYFGTRRLPGVFLYNPQNVYALTFHAEQVPHPDSRMELAADGETLVIRYRLTDQDIDSVIRTHQLLDRWLRQCGCGELQYWYPEKELPAAIRGMSRDGIHQIGTTRIADSPAAGVVDRNLRVWGTSNLYVCSSSVFPTSSQANPTFMLGAFAARLAKWLGRE